MTKQEQFLWIVQTVVLANATNLASRPDLTDEYRTTEVTAWGAYITMDQAVRVSERIPEKLTAAEAAHDFCGFFLKNLRDAEEKPPTVPYWCADY